MKKRDSLTQTLFETLLDWLDTDRDKAGEKYEQIRLRLITIFARRGCVTPDELADETIDRVCLKLPQIRKSYVGNRNLYFYGVAKNIFREHLKPPHDAPSPASPLPLLGPSLEQDQKHLCLDKCLTALDEQNREFILQYYEGDKGVKVANRRETAALLGVSIEAARMRAHRIKGLLQNCVTECLGQTV